MTQRNRTTRHGEADPRTLIPHAANFRIHPASQRGIMRAALDEIGWVDEVVVSEATGRIVNGHMRVEEAVAAGERTVPVRYVDLSDDEERLVLAAYDRLASLAEVDGRALGRLLSEVETGSTVLKSMLDDYSREFAAGVGAVVEDGPAAAAMPRPSDDEDEARIVVGCYVQRIDGQRYRDWMGEVVEDLGGDGREALQEEFRGRLGFHAD